MAQTQTQAQAQVQTQVQTQTQTSSAPTSPLLSFASNGTSVSNGTVNESAPLTISTASLASFNATSFWINIDGTATGPYTATTVTATAKAIGIAPGLHTFKTKACNTNNDCSTFESSTAVTLNVTGVTVTNVTASPSVPEQKTFFSLLGKESNYRGLLEKILGFDMESETTTRRENGSAQGAIIHEANAIIHITDLNKTPMSGMAGANGSLSAEDLVDWQNVNRDIRVDRRYSYKESQ